MSAATVSKLILTAHALKLRLPTLMIISARILELVTLLMVVVATGPALHNRGMARMTGLYELVLNYFQAYALVTVLLVQQQLVFVQTTGRAVSRTAMVDASQHVAAMEVHLV